MDLIFYLSLEGRSKRNMKLFYLRQMNHYLKHIRNTWLKKALLSTKIR